MRHGHHAGTPWYLRTAGSASAPEMLRPDRRIEGRPGESEEGREALGVPGLKQTMEAPVLPNREEPGPSPEMLQRRDRRQGA